MTAVLAPPKGTSWCRVCAQPGAPHPRDVDLVVHVGRRFPCRVRPRALVLPQRLVDEMVGHARRDHPVEACGVLVGRGPAPERCIPLVNASGSTTAYEVDLFALLAMHSEIAWSGEEVRVVYHSHTATAAYPSRMDVEHANQDGAVYVIVSTRDPEHAEVRAYRIVGGSVVEVPVQVR